MLLPQVKPLPLLRADELLTFWLKLNGPVGALKAGKLVVAANDPAGAPIMKSADAAENMPEIGKSRLCNM